MLRLSVLASVGHRRRDAVGLASDRDYMIDASLADASVNIERNVSIMNRTSRFTVTALAALLAGAPVAVFAQTTSPGTPGTATGSSMSGSSTATPGMGTLAIAIHQTGK